MLDILLDNNQSPSKQKQLDGISNIYAGGFKYEPILQNVTTLTSDTNTIDFIFENDIQIINESSSSITSSLQSNNISIGLPFFEGNINDPLNIPNGSNILNFNGNFSLKFPVTRNTPYPGEIIQKISGSVSIKFNVKPYDNISTKFFSGTSGNGTVWVVNGYFEDGWLGDNNTPGNPLSGTTNNIKSLIVAENSKVTIANAAGEGGNYNYVTSYNTPGLKNTTTHYNNYPLTNGGNGVDYIKVEALNITSSFTLNSFQNNFGGNPINDLTQNPFPLSSSKEIVLTFPILGEIKIPAGSTNGNYPLNILNTNQIGFIQYNATFIEINGNKLSIESSSLVQLSPLIKYNQPYYYTNPPEYLYITGAIDYGYNSGSAPLDNWYFERQNSVTGGSFYNKLVGSYYLSDIIYKLYNNKIIQSNPDLTSLGYEPIENYKLNLFDVTLDPFEFKIGFGEDKNIKPKDIDTYYSY
jgi:hypothetical protein